jgi:hypothetical protein
LNRNDSERGGRGPAAPFFLWPTPAIAGILLAAAVLASAAYAQAGLLLSWNDCVAGISASQNKTFDCDSNLGEDRLFAAFRVASSVDSVLGFEVVVDLQGSSSTLVDWWQVGFGRCRDGALRADDDFTLGSCASPWNTAASGGVLSYTPTMPRGQNNQSRVLIALAVPSDNMGTLLPATTYYASRIVLSHVRTTGDPSCAGCQEPVCMVLNTILLRRPPRPIGAPSGDVRINGADATGSNQVAWQGASGTLCDAVPTHRTTWGALKSLYR